MRPLLIVLAAWCACQAEPHNPTPSGEAAADTKAEQNVTSGQISQEIESIEGKWVPINPTYDEAGIVIEHEYTKERLIVRYGKARTVMSRTRYTIDTSQSPAWITRHFDDSGSKSRGIYRFKNGELHVALEISDDKPRPVDFESGYTRYRRVSPVSPNR